jgi:hypothetical protein
VERARIPWEHQVAGRAGRGVRKDSEVLGGPSRSDSLTVCHTRVGLPSAFRREEAGVQEAGLRWTVAALFRVIGSGLDEQRPAAAGLALGAPAPTSGSIVAAGVAGAPWAKLARRAAFVWCGPPRAEVVPKMCVEEKCRFSGQRKRSARCTRCPRRRPGARRGKPARRAMRPRGAPRPRHYPPSLWGATLGTRARRLGF